MTVIQLAFSAVAFGAQEEEIDFSSMKRYHDFPLGPVGDYEPRKVIKHLHDLITNVVNVIIHHSKPATPVLAAYMMLCCEL